MNDEAIVIHGAREHNLRDIDLKLPRNRLIVMTGVSGSGKSSLAFDTLYAEGQRRYVESLSSYARQFLGQMPKPNVDAISGLAPSISIQQKTTGRNPRSTVGTITEIYDYLRVLYARVGTPYCSRCGREIAAQSAERMIDSIAALPEGTRFHILAPVVQQQKGEFRDLFEDLRKRGYLRARVNGRLVRLDEPLRLERQRKHTIEVVVDRLQSGKTSRTRLAEAVESALRLSQGTLIVAFEAPDGTDGSPASGSAGHPQASERVGSERLASERLYSAHYACTACGIGYEPPTPQLFSFNSPQGMCPECNGLGMRHEFVVEALVSDPSLSIAKGAIELLGTWRSLGRWRRHIFEGAATAIEHDLDMEPGSLLKTPWCELPAEAQRRFLYGTGDRHITFAWRHRGGVWKHGGTYAGYVAELLESYRKTRNPMRRRQLEKYMRFVACSACEGTRLTPQARHVRIRSTHPRFQQPNEAASKALPEVCALTIDEAVDFFQELDLDETGRLIAEEALKEIRGRLGFLQRCGLGYLTLDRSAPTLSGGETQRIRLAGQIGCGLTGVVYVLDEPSIGLHPRDNQLLLESLCDLRDQGNTVIVVEHDEETIRAADHVVDFGPGPGIRGGEIVAQGTLRDITRSPRSLTGQYLKGRRRIPVPRRRREPGENALWIRDARHNNLQGIDVRIPLGLFVCVTGVSGSGKSSLVNDILWQVLNRDINGGKGRPGAHGKVEGLEHLDKAIDIDQSPIGRTPRSNPATYVKVFDHIRSFFARLPDARRRGFKPGRFSFNVADGRCEACEGYGSTRLEMDFLADIWVTCPVCEGRRFNRETLEVRYKGASIADVLDMDVQQALEHFADIPPIANLLKTLHDVGLDYIKLGQPSPTLSGGEAQRIKLARELGKRSTGRTIYLLDEPTTGLHFEDVRKLLEVLHGFVDAGNTVLIVEHHLDVVKTADWVIDLGPEGGAGGGRIVAEGTPEQLAEHPESYTGRMLRPLLEVHGNGAAHGSKRGAKHSRPLAAETTGKRGNGVTKAKRGLRRRSIVVRGAAEHNLQHIDVTIPHNRLSVFSGPSGSGKTSLAMDTLYAEGQRRYVESLSAYARQFLDRMPKPKVEHIHGLAPAIAIEQGNTGTTPRSTVGTVTEIYDYLRVLYARLGVPHCPDCGEKVAPQTSDEVVERILRHPVGTRILVLAPQEVRVGQSYEALWESLRSAGFRRVRIDGTTHRLDDVPDLDNRRRHDVEVVVDRITLGPDVRSRLADSVETAFQLGRGLLRIALCDDQRDEPDWEAQPFSLLRACLRCGRSFEELTPHNFSFNSSLGWCPACEGLGTETGANLSMLVGTPEASLSEGAVSAWPDLATDTLFRRMVETMAQACGIPLDVPFSHLDPVHKRMILYGTGDRWFEMPCDGSSPASSRRRSTGDAEAAFAAFRFQYKGLYPAVEEAARCSHVYRQQLFDLMGEVPCSACGGSRLRDDAAAVRFAGVTLGQLCEWPLDEVLAFLKGIKLSARDRKIAGELLREAKSRLSFLVDVGLDYLTLSRPLPTLSGGEMQRIRLAGQVGRALTGVLYVLDEPTVGLHPRDNGRLIRALERLRDLGNTVVLVEHDREVIEHADRLYDFGPRAGRFGGQIVAQGTPKQLARRNASLTGRYLSGRSVIPIPNRRRLPRVGEVAGQAERAEGESDVDLYVRQTVPPGGGWLELTGASLNNLRHVDLRLPLGTLVCVTGVSGSGKSSLVEETLARAVARALHRSCDPPGPFDSLRGIERLDKVIVVDQQPLGSTPASNPATYTGVFDHIRELFARLPEAKVRGYRPGRFSFNRPGGRCDACEGNGKKRIEMHFLPDVWIDCDVCGGKRYNAETLAVRFRGYSIADVLDLSIGRARELFDNIPKIRAVLATLCAIGLDYLSLGQPAPTLSGGEAQRVKLAAELARPQSGRTLYILDEPTTGLHADDIAKLLMVLNSLVEAGNTVVVIEHNLDVIKTADWLVDLGPEAGRQGGWIVAEGTPEDVADYALRVRAAQTSAKPATRRNGRSANRAENAPRESGKRRRSSSGGMPTSTHWVSYTGELLAPVLEHTPRAERQTFDAREAARKRRGDVTLAEVGRETQPPWTVDGPRWHTVDRLDHYGRPCRWDGRALSFVIEMLESQGRFLPTRWNHRSIVEVTASQRQTHWFLHAQTADEWLLTLKFRVRRRTFNAEELDRQLGLRPIDDWDELPIYGRGPRVRVKNLKGAWQEVTITVHQREEIDTPAFREFLQRACRSYFSLVAPEPARRDELLPWKKLGRKWHLSRKGFPTNRRIAWPADLLERLFQLLETLLPEAEFDWSRKQVVYVRRPDEPEVCLTVHTKRRDGIDVTLLAPADTWTAGQLGSLGSEREIRPAKNGRQAVRVRLTTRGHLDDPRLKRLLGAHLNGTAEAHDI